MALFKKVVQTIEKKTTRIGVDGKPFDIIERVPFEEEVQLSADEEAAVLAEWAIADAMQEQTNYIENRKNEYPPMEKQLEILCEQGLDALRAVISAVKAKYPKPIAKQ